MFRVVILNNLTEISSDHELNVVIKYLLEMAKELNFALVLFDGIINLNAADINDQPTHFDLEHFDVFNKELTTVCIMHHRNKRIGLKGHEAYEVIQYDLESERPTVNTFSVERKRFRDDFD